MFSPGGYFMRIIFISTAHKNSRYEQDQTGDVDYATKIAEILERKGEKITYIRNVFDENKIYDQLKDAQKINPDAQIILHIMINAPHTGAAFSIEGLQQFKQETKVNIVITAIEFEKVTCDKKQTLQYCECADSIIFLDEMDKYSAICHYRAQKKYSALCFEKLKNAAVISVPPTIPTSISQNANSANSESNILVFGMIRHGKGFSHVIKLAELIKAHQDIPQLAGKKILIVGSVQNHKTAKNETAYDETLYNLMCAMFPGLPALLQTVYYSLEGFVSGYSPECLIKILNDSKQHGVKSQLPIELHVNIPPNKLHDLFSRCKYAFSPLWRGATFRNSSICSMLANKKIIFSHVGAITPDCLFRGEHKNAMVLRNVDEEPTDRDKGYAEFVKEKIIEIESQSELTQKIYSAIDHVLETDLSVLQITTKHQDVYSESCVLANDNSTIQVNEIKQPESKRHMDRSIDEIKSAQENQLLINERSNEQHVEQIKKTYLEIENQLNKLQKQAGQNSPVQLLKEEKSENPVQLSPEELLNDEKRNRMAIAMQDRRKILISRQRVKTRSKEDLGTNKAIDICKKSKENLAGVRNRLRNCQYLSEADRNLLKNEGKKEGAMLSPAEISLYETLLNKTYIIHHTTSAPLLAEILEQKQPILLDQQEARRRGIEPQTATPSFCGAEYMLYFGFGTGSGSTLPFFLRQRHNAKTGNIEDYATVFIDFDKACRGMSTGGHKAHYQQGNAIPPRLELKLGTTKYTMGYETQNRLDPYEKQYVKYLNFERNDGSIIRQHIAIDEEIASEKDILPWFVFTFIERLRFIGGELRQYLLGHTDDHELIDMLIEKLFRVDDFEVYVPTKVPLNDEKHIRIITPQKRKIMTEVVRDAAAAGNIQQLQALKENNYPFDGYMYEDEFQYDGTKPTTLPVVAAIKNNQQEAIAWLIKNGANRFVFRNADDKVRYFIDDADHDVTGEFLQIVGAALENGNLQLLNELGKQGLDYNEYAKLHLENELQKNAKYQDKNRSNRQLLINAGFYKYSYWGLDIDSSDPVFLKVIALVAATNNFALLDWALAKLEYCRKTENIGMRLITDIARFGNPDILNYFIRKILGRENIWLDYCNLFCKAAYTNNLQMLSYFWPHITNDENGNNLQMVAMDTMKTGCLDAFDYILDQGKLSLKDLVIPDSISLYSSVVPMLFDFVLSAGDMDRRIRWIVEKHGQELGENDLANLLYSAVKAKLYETAKWLIEEKQASLKIVKNNMIPEYNLIAGVLEENNTKFADYLLSIGMELPQDCTAIFVASIKAKRNEVIGWLMEKKAPVDMKSVFQALLADDPVMFELVIPSEEMPQSIANRGKDFLSAISTLKKLYNTVVIPEDADREIIARQNNLIKTFISFYPEYQIFSAVIALGNVRMLNWLCKKYTFIPEFFYDFFVQTGEQIYSIATLEWLLKHGVDVNARNKNGCSLCECILHRTDARVHAYDDEKLKLLTRYKAETSEAVKKYGTAFLVNAILTSSGYLLFEIASWLIANKVEINAYGPNNLTPLAAACSRGNVMMVAELLRAGADPEYGEEFVSTPLAVVMKQNEPNAKIIEILRKAGVSINLKTSKHNDAANKPYSSGDARYALFQNRPHQFKLDTNSVLLSDHKAGNVTSASST